MDACCVIAIILGLGNIVCWLTVFNKPFSLKSNGRELTIGQQINTDLEKNVNILKGEIQELKEVIKNGNNGNHKSEEPKGKSNKQ